MSEMFGYAKSFNGDISKWDVSSVENMHNMFWGAASFNGDLSKWDVSQVKDMEQMFYRATAFTQKLCTAPWVNSKASKTGMFDHSSGSISRTICTMRAIPPMFSPQSRAELKSAVDACKQAVGLAESRSPFGGCSMMLHVHLLTRVLHFRLIVRKSAVAKSAKYHCGLFL